MRLRPAPDPAPRDQDCFQGLLGSGPHQKQVLRSCRFVLRARVPPSGVLCVNPARGILALTGNDAALGVGFVSPRRSGSESRCINLERPGLRPQNAPSAHVRMDEWSHAFSADGITSASAKTSRRTASRILPVI